MRGVFSKVGKVSSRSRVIRLKLSSEPALSPIRTQVWVRAMQSAIFGSESREPLVISPMRRPASCAASQISTYPGWMVHSPLPQKVTARPPVAANSRISRIAASVLMESLKEKRS